VSSSIYHTGTGDFDIFDAYFGGDARLFHFDRSGNSTYIYPGNGYYHRLKVHPNGVTVDNGGLEINGTLPNKNIGTINKHTYNHFNNLQGFTSYSEPGISLTVKGSVWIRNVDGYGHIFMSSDERIKKNITDANTTTALDLINQMKFCKYGYKDILFNGDNRVYGFIAQQIKEVYPNAVSLTAEYISDDIRFIDNPQWEKHNDKWKLYIEDILFEDNHTGKCCFYTAETNDDDIKENKFTIQVEDDKKTFIFDKKWNVVFLHSREINDFHKLNKNDIFTIQHGAIQELDRKHIRDVNALQVETAALQVETTALQVETAALQAENTALKNDIEVLKTQMQQIMTKLA